MSLHNDLRFVRNEKCIRILLIQNSTHSLISEGPWEFHERSVYIKRRAYFQAINHIALCLKFWLNCYSQVFSFILHLMLTAALHCEMASPVS